LGTWVEPPQTVSELHDKDFNFYLQEAKYLLMTGFHKVEFGSWVGKPDEVDQFISSEDHQ